MMGYKTPNIDSIAAEGALFTDWYGQQELPPPVAPRSSRPVADPDRPHKVGLPGARKA